MHIVTHFSFRTLDFQTQYSHEAPNIVVKSINVSVFRVSGSALLARRASLPGRPAYTAQELTCPGQADRGFVAPCYLWQGRCYRILIIHRINSHTSHCRSVPFANDWNCNWLTVIENGSGDSIEITSLGCFRFPLRLLYAGFAVSRRDIVCEFCTFAVLWRAGHNLPVPCTL